MPAITEAGGCLIAISQKPDGSLSMTEKNHITYHVLSDVGNAAARKFGLVYRIPVNLKATHTSFGADLANDSWELPTPATFVINGLSQETFSRGDHRCPEECSRINESDVETER